MFILNSKNMRVPVVFDMDMETRFQEIVCTTPPFSDWWNTIDADKLAVKSITIQSVDVFGSGNVGFVKINVAAREVATGKRMPGIVFLRGGSVAVLPLLVTDAGNLCTLVCRQMSVAAGIPLLGCPSGILDGEGNFAGAAAREMFEETGLEFAAEDLLDLVDILTPTDNYNNTLWSSPGGSDETFRLYTAVKHGVPEHHISHLLSQVHGTSEHEHITLLHVPLEIGSIGNTLLQVTQDVKSYAAGAMLDQAIVSGLISIER